MQFEKQALADHVNNLKEQLSQLIRTDKTVVLLEGGSNTNLDNEIISQTFQAEEVSKILNEQQ